MANPDRPRGFRPVKALSGAPWNSLVRRLQVGDASSDTTNGHGNIFIGDPIKLSSGKALAANSGDTVVGVVVGVGKEVGNHGGPGPFNPSNLEQRYVPLTETSSSSAWYVWYVPAEHVLFEVQSASDLDLVVGSAADTNVVAATAHGDTTTGFSNAELTTASDNDVIVVEIPDYPDNDPTLANTRYHVLFTIKAFEG